MDFEKALEFFFVFDGLVLENKYFDLLKAIDEEILQNYKKFKYKFSFKEYDFETKKALKNLARGSRKQFNFYKGIPRKSAINVKEILLENGLIKIEKSKEIKKILPKNQKLKRELRRYQIQDKILFCDNFTRFWFYFCEPNLNLLACGKKNLVLKKIKSELNNYFGLPFERWCIEFLCAKLDIKDYEISSYWDKFREFDIYLNDSELKLAGEVKYKSKRVCKDVLNELICKCECINFKPDFYVIFSKSGFSYELENLKDDRVLLFSLNDFKEIL